MSVAVSSWVWKHSKTNGNDRLLLLAIADVADDDGDNAWPSIATLADKATVSERTVQRRIQKLEELGCLTVHRGAGRHGTHRYRVRMDDGAKKPPKAAKPRPDTTAGGDKLSPPDNVSGEVTQLRRADPDTQVSPERPERPTTPPNPPAASRQGAKNRCRRHGNKPGANCRRCGTNPRGAEQRLSLEAAERAAAAIAAIERDREELQPCRDPDCDPETRWRSPDDGPTSRCPECHPDVVIGRPTAAQLELVRLLPALRPAS